MKIVTRLGCKPYCLTPHSTEYHCVSCYTADLGLLAFFFWWKNIDYCELLVQRVSFHVDTRPDFVQYQTFSEYIRWKRCGPCSAMIGTSSLASASYSPSCQEVMGWNHEDAKPSVVRSPWVHYWPTLWVKRMTLLTPVNQSSARQSQMLHEVQFKRIQWLYICRRTKVVAFIHSDWEQVRSS